MPWPRTSFSAISNWTAIVGGAEGDVVDTTGALPATEEIARFAQINDAAKGRVASFRNVDHRSFLSGLGEAEDVGQDRRWGAGVRNQQTGAAESRGSHTPPGLCRRSMRSALGARNGDERKSQAVRSLNATVSGRTASQARRGAAPAR